MYYKKRTHLIAYIDGMLHSCLQGKTITHKVAACPNRQQVIAGFIEKYELGQWAPIGELQEMPEENKKGRDQLGSYVTEDTRD